ncbi:MAG TPA: MFS transporter [Anaerolineae bacterium]|nr:MFS transporter [Anaerolineae bacterium]
MARQRADSAPVNPEDKLDFKRILPIFVIVLIDLLGMTIIIPLMPLYATTFGASPLVIGLLGAIYPIMQFIGAPILGRLSDQYGRKPILLISQLGTFIGFIMLGLAQALPMLFLSRALDGLSGANVSTAQAVITDSTNERTRTQGLGLLGAAFGLGFVVGPVIAFISLAITKNDYRAPAFVAAFFSLISILLTYLWLQETHGPEKRGTDARKSAFSMSALFAALKHPAVGVLLLLLFFQQIAFGGFEQLLTLFTLERLGLNASGNAIIFVLVGVIVVAVQGGYVGKWSRKYGDRRVIFAGLALLAIGLALMAFTPRQPPPWYSKTEMRTELAQNGSAGAAGHSNLSATGDVAVTLPEDTNDGWLGLIWIMAAMIPLAIGGGVLQPTINSLITKRIDPLEVGGTLGISAALLSGANALAPLIGGLLFQFGGPTLMFIAWGLMMGVLWLIARARVTPGREEQAPAGLARGGAAAH